jgi:hypothetical protein
MNSRDGLDAPISQRLPVMARLEPSIPIRSSTFSIALERYHRVTELESVASIVAAVRNVHFDKSRFETRRCDCQAIGLEHEFPGNTVGGPLE